MWKRTVATNLRQRQRLIVLRDCLTLFSSIVLYSRCKFFLSHQGMTQFYWLSNVILVFLYQNSCVVCYESYFPFLWQYSREKIYPQGSSPLVDNKPFLPADTKRSLPADISDSKALESDRAASLKMCMSWNYNTFLKIYWKKIDELL